jgi:hypothetical protein
MTDDQKKQFNDELERQLEIEELGLEQYEWLILLKCIKKAQEAVKPHGTN